MVKLGDRIQMGGQNNVVEYCAQGGERKTQDTKSKLLTRGILSRD